MGPSDIQQSSELERTEEEALRQVTENCFLPEYSPSTLDPLESTHLDGSFKEGWIEPFELPTNSEDQFEDYGEVESSSSKKSSHCRTPGICRTSSNLSCLDTEVTSCSEAVEKLTFLEDRISELEGENSRLEESEHKLRQTNKELVKRMHLLEEELQDEKLHLEEERREHLALRESSFHKAERKWGLDMEKIHTRLKLLQEENSQLSLSVSTLHNENRILEKKVQSVVTEVLQASESLVKEQDKTKQLEETLCQERAAWELQRQESAQLIEDLRSELARQRWTDGTVRCCDEDCAQSLLEECKLQKERLAEENRSLRDLNEELQDALLLQGGALCFNQRDSRGSSPSTQGSPVHSIADEIEVCTKDQVSALNEQKEINRRLRQYLDRMILSVLEKDPTLLEVKPSM
ncbi:rab11 family-interacting protein 4A-like [Discoglossus pictus]